MFFESIFCGKLGKRGSFKFKGSLLLLCLLVSAIVPLVTIPSAAAADPGTFTRKWTGYVAGGGEALLTADVNASVPGEEIFHAGGGAKPNEPGGSVTCLNGRTGAVLWKTGTGGLPAITAIGDTCQPTMVDMDQNGDLELVVPLQYPGGIYFLHAENGRTMYSNTSLGGRIDASPVAADVDGNGYPDLFLAIMGFEEQPTTGKVIRFEWDPATSRIVERDRVTVWHPCAGGLSIADTDNDGTWELYMNERHVYFGDGAWGRGIVSFWASNLTVRWQVYDWGASSNIPMLADVNRDGIVDVVTTDLSAGVCVLNSSTGRPLSNGVRDLKQTGISGRHNHYQSSIYDIDHDGNIEVLSGDGFEGEFNYVTVFDLWNWTLDASLDTTIVGPVLTRSWKGPTVGEVTGDGIMDIIVTTFDPTAANNGMVQVYDRNYNLVYLNTGLRHRAIESVVQDVDKDDGGLNELLILTQGGVIYCFDTPGIASTPRARSEVQFYSESRTGVSEYVPLERPYPDVSNPSPTQMAVGVSTGLTSLSFRLNHPLGQTMSYTVTTTPNIGGGSGSNVGNGVRTVAVSGLLPSTQYRWHVTVTDQSSHTTNKDYSFTTGPYIPNNAPIQSTPTITGSSIFDNLVTTSHATDPDVGDNVTSIFNWEKNGVSLATVNLPFETQTDNQDEYSGLATTKDYAYGATANVFGATWVPNGRVGGAYSFDGNDFIRIPEATTTSTRTRYDGYGTWSAMSVEFWVKANVMSSTEKLIVKQNLYDSNTSYRIDCGRTSNSLSFTWRVGTGVLPTPTTYTLGPYSVTTGAGDWHHVVCTYKSGVGLRLYIDGVQVSSLLGPSYTGNILNSDGPFDIAFGSGSDYLGLIDEVRLYPYEVSPYGVNQRYLDTRNGLSSNSTISKYDTEVGEQWRCQVTPNDGSIDGAAVYTATRTILDAANTPPVASNLFITPASPVTGDDLVANYTYYDAEGNPEAGSIVSWYRNSVWVFDNPTLPNSLTARGEVWSFKVTPSDGFDYGTQVTSGSVTIVNSPPSITSGVILPNPAFDSSTLTASPTGWNDPDNDTAAYTYQWQKLVGGIYTDIPGATTVNLTTQYFAPGDWIRVQATPFDGQLYGTPVAFGTQIINSAPPTTGTPVLVSGSGSNRDDDELTCSAVNTQDPDGDTTTNIYNWLRSGTSITKLYMPFAVNSSTTAKDYSSNGNDGAVSGAIWTPQGVVGGAYSFDGTDVITVADSPSLRNEMDALTIEYWVNPSVDQRRTTILDKNGGSATTNGKYLSGFSSSYSSPNNMIFFGVTVVDTYAEGGTAFQQVYSNPASVIPTGSWSHVVGTYRSGDGLKLYINGTLAASLEVSGNIVASADEPLLIGYSSPVGGTANRYFIGRLDEVRIYTTALSAAQVFQDFIDQKDGLSNSVTIAPQETSSGQTWQCQVTPNDGWQDGTTKLSNQLSIVSGNTRPRIDWYSPANKQLQAHVGDSIAFNETTTDPDGSPLSYSWTLDSIQQATTQNWVYTPTSASPHTVRVTASDGTSSDYQEWTVNVVEGTQSKAYLTVRGSDDTIYYRAYDGVWQSWASVPNGATPDTPASAVCQGKLYTVVRSMDGSSLWLSSINLADSSFSGWTNIEGSTPSAPTLTSNGTHLFLIVRGMDDTIYLRIYNCLTSTWGNWVALPGSTSDTASAAVVGNNLHIVVRGTSDTMSLWHGYVTLSDMSFSGWSSLAGGSDAAPTLAACPDLNAAYLCVKGQDNHIYINKWTGGVWQGWSALSSGSTIDTPAAAATDETLQIVVRGSDGNSLWHCSLDLNTQAQSAWSNIGGSTPSTPTLTS